MRETTFNVTTTISVIFCNIFKLAKKGKNFKNTLEFPCQTLNGSLWQLSGASNKDHGKTRKYPTVMQMIF